MIQEQEFSSEAEPLDHRSKCAKRELRPYQRSEWWWPGNCEGRELQSRSKACEVSFFTRDHRKRGDASQGGNEMSTESGMSLKRRGARASCERCGRHPRERVMCVGGCRRRVGPGCGQKNVSLRCLLVEFPRLASRRSVHYRTGICVDCIGQNSHGFQSSVLYNSTLHESTSLQLGRH